VGIRYLEYELLLNRDFLTVLQDLVSEAGKRIYVASCIASLTKTTFDIYYAMAEKARKGVDVRVVLNGASEGVREFNEATANFLRSIGVDNVKLTEKSMCVKLYIVDDYFIIGSHNLSRPLFKNRYEVSLMIHSKNMSRVLSKVFMEILANERADPFAFRGVVYDAYYEILANYRMLSDIFQKTLLSGQRVKIMMYIASMSKATTKYYRLLQDKQAEGVEVAVMLNGAQGSWRAYNERVYEFLKSIGISRAMLTSSFVHAKLLIIDDIVVLGSHNLTSASIAGRLELSVAVKSKTLANALDAIFEEKWREEDGLAKHSLNTFKLT